MAIPLKQALKVGYYLFKQKIVGRRRYPLVMMLEPLFRCNLECIGCGKIQKTQEILKKHLTPEDCFRAAEECDAPVVSIAGGEPLIHPNIVEIVEGLLKQDRIIYLCTNALLLHKFLDKLPRDPRLTLSIHLDGNENEHDRIVAQEGTYKIAVDAIRQAKSMGFRVSCNTTIFDGVSIEEAEEFFDTLGPLNVDGITVSSGFQYLDAPDQDHFMARKKTHSFFHELLEKNTNGRWDFNHSPLYMEFLCGKRDYDCTPWGNPNYSVLGWQKPCYLLDDGYASSFKELMEDTQWENYGHRNNPKCANCTAHCGYEATAVEDSTSNLKNMFLSLKAVLA
ncbi:MAG: adenosyl-hopene transferase HpnH [Nitrospinota bacterium]|nr:adenosyl-hopene transferase HpnH [Nitrospinota bacterium]